MIYQKIVQKSPKNQPKLALKLASTAVVAIRFLFEDMSVITARGTDTTLLRWKIV